MMLRSICSPCAADKASDKLSVYTVNYPLQYFAQRIAAEHATVTFPAPAHGDPAYWMPDKKTIAAHQNADLILLNGAHYAKWLEKVTLPRAKMVNTSRKFRDQYIASKEAITHSHGSDGEHAHEDAAFTIWLDFTLAVKQAQAIEKTLSRKRPALKKTFRKNYADLEKDLMELDRDLREVVAQRKSLPLVASHPVYDYLAKGYGITIKSVHWEPDESPAARQWRNLREILASHPAQWMIWEGEPLPATSGKLKAMGINSIVYDPCGNIPSQGDFLSVMRQNIENLKLAFQ